jgi:hypothetical protein
MTKTVLGAIQNSRMHVYPYSIQSGAGTPASSRSFAIFHCASIFRCSDAMPEGWPGVLQRIKTLFDPNQHQICDAFAADPASLGRLQPGILR